MLIFSISYYMLSFQWNSVKAISVRTPTTPGINTSSHNASVIGGVPDRSI